MLLPRKGGRIPNHYLEDAVQAYGLSGNLAQTARTFGIDNKTLRRAIQNKIHLGTPRNEHIQRITGPKPLITEAVLQV